MCSSCRTKRCVVTPQLGRMATGSKGARATPWEALWRLGVRVLEGAFMSCMSARSSSAGVAPLQVIDAAMEAGAEDVQATEGEDGECAGFKVRTPCALKYANTVHAFAHNAAPALPLIVCQFLTGDAPLMLLVEPGG